MALFFLAIFGVLFLAQFLVLRPRGGRLDPALKTTPLAFAVQLAIILFLLVSKLYWPEVRTQNRWEALDQVFLFVVIFGCSANLVWMYFRLFHRYERLLSLQPPENDPAKRG